jgi:maltooligosyltrehalose trehalohydrolase
LTTGSASATTSPADIPLGASCRSGGRWSFLVWAPRQDIVAVRLAGEGDGHSGDEAIDHPMEPYEGGYFFLELPGLDRAPTYHFVLADGNSLPDPASRWQPDGVHGPSRGVDPAAFEWTDGGFAGPVRSQSVIYELHIGTFTAEGTFDAAIEHLPELAELGITTVEPMPIAAFPGRRNWGYDGVFPFAAQDSYGGPAGFQRFVDACHKHGLAVMLDVVYNHLGPEGNVLSAYGPYFTDVYATPWGAAVNVSEAGSDEVRRYFIENALMWLRDYHVDGLRLDAIHGIVDPTASPFLAELTTAVERVATQLDRSWLLIAESSDNNPKVVSPVAAGGLGFGGQWDDDFHHALHALLTGERDGYYADYGTVEDLAAAFSDGFVYEGQYSAFRGRRHGATAAGVPRDRFVVFAQNHDQIGNRAAAERLTSLVSEDAARLAMAALLLSPFVPLLFMGEEYAETAPFPYFVDHGDPGLLEAVREGRAKEFARDADAFDPAATETFDLARLDRAGRETDSGRCRLALVRTLLAARRDHAVLTDPGAIESRVAVSDDVIRVTRTGSTGASFVALNTAAAERAVGADVGAQRWRCVIDSAAAVIGGRGDRLPAELGAAEPFTLPGFGFCMYVAASPEVED